MFTRRILLQGIAGSAAAAGLGMLSRRTRAASQKAAAAISPPRAGEDVFGYIRRLNGAHDVTACAQILGAANEFKEGDAIIGVAAADEASRQHARTLLSETRLADIDRHPLHQDELFRLISRSRTTTAAESLADASLAQFRQFLLTAKEAAIRAVMPGLSSDVIACVVKLMSNEELIQVGQKIFNPLPGTRIGARGYLGARVQPNSPTDHVDDIRWQVLDAWSYGVGDVLLGTNPVSSDPNSVMAIERTLQDLLTAFEINDLMPHCVLSHIDVQAQVERDWPGSTELWFQSIAGCDSANETFDISVEKMQRYAGMRRGRYGLYFETGQGADFTNGHGHGFDMLLHESRKYGLARALSQTVAQASQAAGDLTGPWVHLNDVAGFIGPEVFRTREQLVRCCLEDIVMGKLHGLCLGLDVCSTLHMDVTLDDLDWCLDQIMPANPAYLMALPTKIDPMLGYLTTGYQDHIRLRQKFGYRVNDSMWAFFQSLDIIDRNGHPTQHFGDPLWVFLQYRRRKGDSRSDQEIMEAGRQQLAEVRERGVFVAEGFGERPWDLHPDLNREIRRIYDDAKVSLRAELTPEFIETVPNVLPLGTLSADRDDYILHPTTGESPNAQSVARLQQLRQQQAGQFNIQFVISDGLNALAIMDDDQLRVFLDDTRRQLMERGFRVASEHVLMTSGRVRAGYRIGELLFADLPGPRAVLHVIGERPGTGHRTFSTYITAPQGDVWGQAGKADHNITKVVSGIADTALAPSRAAKEVVRLVAAMMP